MTTLPQRCPRRFGAATQPPDCLLVGSETKVAHPPVGAVTP